jgi:hypothetical protein
MFEVLFVNNRGDRERHVVKAHWLARQIARRAVEDDSRGIVVRPLRTDVWLVDAETGTMDRVAADLSPKSAANLTKEWAGTDRRSGMLLWPSECSVPPKVRANRAS